MKIPNADQSSHNFKPILQNEEQFEMLVNSAPNGIIVVSGKGIIAFVNSRAAQMFRYTRQQMIGLQIEELVPERYRLQHTEYRKEYLQNPIARPMGVGRDLYGRCKNGSELPVEIGLNPIQIGDDVFILVSLIDITKRKRAEQDVLYYMNELKQINKDLSQYIYAVSHDLRAPLRAIHNYADFLHQDIGESLNGDTQTYLIELGNAICEAEKMVDDLLKLSRIDRKNIFNEKTDIGTVISKLIEIRYKQEAIEITMCRDWPIIEAPVVLIRQIFANLISNAVKFNKSPIKKIELGWKSVDEEKYEIYVRDNGIGIDPRYNERVFGLFERLHLNEDYEGTGIGLAIVKKAVNILKGSIRLESEAGKGSTFYVTLPKSSIRLEHGQDNIHCIDAEDDKHGIIANQRLEATQDSQPV